MSLHPTSYSQTQTNRLVKTFLSYIGNVILFSIILITLTQYLIRVPVPFVATTQTNFGPMPALNGIPISIRTNVTHGTITLRNEKYSVDHIMGSNGQFRLITVSNGTETLTLNAPPFHVITCQVTTANNAVSISGSKDCSIELNELDTLTGTASGTNPPGLPEYVLTVACSLDDLPSSLQTSVKSTFKSAIKHLQQSSAFITTVPAGEPYMSESSSLTNPQPVTAKIALSPYDSTIDSSYESKYSYTIPEVLTEQPNSTNHQQDWKVTTSLNQQWNFTPQGSAMQSLDLKYTDPSFLLSYDNKSGWQASNLDSDTTEDIFTSICNSSANDIPNYMDIPNIEVKNVFFQVTGHPSMAGCHIDAYNAFTPNTRYHYIIRFGYIYAVDDAAQLNTPEIPIAPPAIQNLVK